MKSPDRPRIVFISYPLTDDTQISGISVTTGGSVYRFEGSDADELLSRAEQQLLLQTQTAYELAFVGYETRS